VHFRYFYVLFLPVVWAASRQGLAGAVFCVTIVQLGMMFAGQSYQAAEISLLELQMRAFLLALVGFLIGVAVDEQRRAVADLRQSLRLAAAGEMAGALAHELNQPLTALSAYGSACEQLLARGGDQSQLRDVIRRMVGEAGRAAEVVRRLRDFFRTGATKLDAVALADLVEAAVAPFRAKAAAAAIEFEIVAIPVATVNADRLQIEVVLRNLLSNAFEAVTGGAEPSRKVMLGAAVVPGGRVVVEVADTGPGLTASRTEQVFEPFASTKSSGLGLGLAISRAIAEAHGGSLVADAGNHGCFRLTLPVEVSPHQNRHFAAISP
jgi:C4-dicarboxylate-specific signal transduction histidine kinase